MMDPRRWYRGWLVDAGFGAGSGRITTTVSAGDVLGVLSAGVEYSDSLIVVGRWSLIVIRADGLFAMCVADCKSSDGANGRTQQQRRFIPPPPHSYSIGISGKTYGQWGSAQAKSIPATHLSGHTFASSHRRSSECI